jgi:hypothetical protein
MLGRRDRPPRRLGIDLDEELAAYLGETVPLLDLVVGDLLRLQVIVVGCLDEGLLQRVSREEPPF